MSYEKVLVLGGYGNAGGRIAARLLHETPLDVVVAGRSLERAAAKATELSSGAAGRVSGLALDAHDPGALKAAFDAVDCVIVASSTGNLTEPVALAALDADRRFWGAENPAGSRADVVRSLLPYAESLLASGQRLHRLSRHMLGLFHGVRGGRAWRRALSEGGNREGAGPQLLLEAL